MTLVEALVIAVIEGVTEFLPVSSTGHMILASSWFGIQEDSFTKSYLIIIQFGAILSVVTLYWRRFLVGPKFYLKLFVAFLPAAIIGLLFGDHIDALLESANTVAISLVVGGAVLIWSDYWKIKPPVPLAVDATSKLVNDKKLDETFSSSQALKVGFAQCFALIPGVSRSGATILGGILTGASRTYAAEFSFFLAVPTMFAATVYKIWKTPTPFSSDEIQLLIIGNVVAFVVAMLAIKTFIGLLQRFGFKWFGIYRIILGSFVLIFQ
ncbi:MAG: undecaprenyl-diphosphate phosphatase [Bdellovibrionales bacterium CG10_big_fil_rev_8_21_14_0_10_45_34]|nr:MAG: undecaprenyl-diphosphate phosphatase [Bdellovibrionales bacterium CG10_big_fil_rev_8_21_14_0_10_45_34]